MNQVIMWIMAFGVLLGGIDRILGNPRGYGKKFEEGFMLLGPTALSMAGMICLAPVLVSVFEWAVSPFFHLIGVDPAMIGGILAIDMGGYQLACGLADDPGMGQYAGIIIAAIFGCTIVFTIPVGMGIIEKEDKPLFARGILIGLMTMPVAFVAGGMVCKMTILHVLHQTLPILFLSLLLMVGLWKIPDQMVRGFTVFASGIQIVIPIGLMLAAFIYMTGMEILPGMAPMEEAMRVVASIGIVLLGSLPIAELFMRVLHGPLVWMGKKTGMNHVSMAGLLIGLISVLPALSMMKEMDKKGKVVTAAWFVSATSMLAAHLGFTVSEAPDMLSALFAAKLAGAAAAAATALIWDMKKQ